MQTQDQSTVGGSDSAVPWFPNSSLGTYPATKTPFCFPFVLPVISDETEFRGEAFPNCSRGYPINIGVVVAPALPGASGPATMQQINCKMTSYCKEERN